MARLTTIILTFFVIHVVGPAAEAKACINGVGVVSISENWRILSRAQTALDHGDFAQARRLAGSVLMKPDLDQEEINRAQWVTAMSYVRDEDAKDEDLVAAAHAMREIAKRRTLTDVVSKVDLGETLARRSATRAEARALLEPLAKDDLIGSPHAYAALSRIAVDSPALQRTALQRCETMAGRDTSLCERGGFGPSTEVEGRRFFIVSTGVLATVALGVALGTVLLILRQRRKTERLLIELRAA